MLFHTPEFALLLIATAVGFVLLRGDGRMWVLLAASIVFYAFGGLIDSLLFAGVMVATYFLAMRLEEQKSPGILIFTLALLFSNLAFFKYGNFLFDNFNMLLGALNMPLLGRGPQLWLPLGISFYTFQLAAYVVDVYRGVINAERKLLTFAVFIMFFGQLVAGPIMRASDFIPQLHKHLLPRFHDLRAGFYLIARGLFKKVVIADRLAVLVELRFDAWATQDHASAWIALYFFAFQVYFDFSGYTDMGIGLGRIFGLRLSPNFATPYLSTNVVDFWRRWHITLSTWLRDYLYIPLGGNRCSVSRRNFNLLLTMLLGGLWHGASWNFVVWGAIHGLWLVIYRSWGSLFTPPERQPVLPRLVSVFITFHVVCLSYVFFRAANFEAAWGMLRQMLDFSQMGTWNAQIAYVSIVFILVALHWAEREMDENIAALSVRWSSIPAPVRGLAYALFAFILILSFRTAQPFIYFRF